MKRYKRFKRKLTMRDKRLIARLYRKGIGPTEISRVLKSKVSPQAISMLLMRHPELVYPPHTTVNDNIVTSNKVVNQIESQDPLLNELDNMLTKPYGGLHVNPPESGPKPPASPPKRIPYELDMSATSRRHRRFPEGTELYSDPNNPGEYLGDD